MWPFIISLTGLFAGMLLAWLVPEELESGKKFFRWAQVVLIFLLFVAGTFFWRAGVLTLLLSFLLALVFIVVVMRKNMEWLSLAVYALFAIPYFQNPVNDFRLILSSLLFLYGLPTGTLLWQEWKKIKP